MEKGDAMDGQRDLLADNGLDVPGPNRASEEAEAGEPREAPRRPGDDEAAPASEGDGAVGAQASPELEPTAPSPTPPSLPGRGEAGDRLARARMLVEQGRADEAVGVYREIVSDHPGSLKAHNNLGVLYDELGQHELALEQFQAAHHLGPENVEVIANLGAALGTLGRFEDAERELRRGQKLEPDSPDIRANLGILFFRRGLYAQAEAELRWVCEHDHDHGPAHFYRGEALNRLGRVEPAIEALERAVRLQPDNAKAFYTLGILFDRKHMPEEAGRMYRRYRELASL